jgi:hypothetical protein
MPLPFFLIHLLPLIYLAVATKEHRRNAAIVLALSTLLTVPTMLIIYSYSKHHGLSHPVILLGIAITLPGFISAFAAETFPASACGALPAMALYLCLAIYIRIYGRGGDSGMGDAIGLAIFMFFALCALVSNFFAFVVNRVWKSRRQA